MNVIARAIDAVVKDGRLVAKYGLAGCGRREVYALPAEGGQALVDISVKGVDGQLFTVDTCWRNEGTLESFLADYVEVAERLGCCPVSPHVEEGGLDCYEDEEVLDLLWRVGRS